jgi:hypothetical protein
MINYIDAAISMIACELVDSKFIHRMLSTAAIVFFSYHYENMPQTDTEKSWIYMVLFVAKVKGLFAKIDVLESKILKLLETICKFRMNA